MTFITYDVTTTDGNNHKVKLYYDNTAEVSVKLLRCYIQIKTSPLPLALCSRSHVQGTVDNVDREVEWKRVNVLAKVTMRIGSYEQVSCQPAKCLYMYVYL